MLVLKLAWSLVFSSIILLEECVSYNGIISVTFHEQEFSSQVTSSFDRSQNFSVKRVHYSQIPGHIFLVVYHNALKCCIDLFMRWKRYTCVILIDKYSGLSENALRIYMKKQPMISEVLTVENNINIKKVLQRSSLQTNFIIICNQTITEKIMSMANTLGFFSTDSTWTIVGDYFPIADSSVVISLKTQVTLVKPVDHKHNVSQIYEAVVSNMVENLDIFDVFYNYKSLDVDVVKFALWTPNQELKILEEFEPGDKIKKLDGRKMRTVVFQHPPYSYISLDNNNALKLKGLSIEVMTILQHHFKLDFDVEKIDENWGNYVNGAFTGAAGYLNRREADLSLNMFAMTSQRLAGIQYGGIIGKLDLTLAYNRPDAAIPPTNYILPFDISVWALVTLAFATIVFLLAIVMVFSPGWQAGEVPTVQTHTKLFRLLTGTFFEEVLEDPPGIPARVLYVSLLISTTLIFIMYTSVFTSFLAYRDLILPIKNLRDVVENDDYIPLSLKDLMQVESLKKAKSGVYHDLWRKMQQKGDACIAPNYMAAVSTMYSGKYVLQADGASIIAAIDNNCSVELIRTEHMREYAYVVSRQDFPFGRIFYSGLNRLLEGGIMRKMWKIHMIDSRPPCTIDEPSLTFGLDQVSGVFFILACGIVMAFISLAVEKVVYRRKVLIKGH